MDYRVASNIRGKSLSSLMADRIASGGSIGSSIRNSISDKLKAKATGVKEKFDPLNIARAMTGGGRLAPAILGRLTGRSQSDINYFAGDKNKKQRSYTQIPSYMNTPGEGLGGSAVDVLNKMLAFMVNSRASDLKKKETAKQFLEEQKVEEQRRQDEFLELLKVYTSLGASTVIKAEEGENMMDKFKRMLDALARKFQSLLDAINVFKNPKALASLVGLLTNPLGLTIAAIIAATYGLQKLADKTPNFSVLTPQEAQDVLNSKDPFAIQQEGGYDKLANIIKNGPAEAQKALDDFKAGRITEPEINKLGGVTKLEEIAKQTGLAVPENVALPDKIQSRPTRRGQSQMMWDQKYGKDYNPDGTRKATQMPNTGAPPAPAATPVPNTPPSPPAENLSSPQPVQQTPSSARMNNAVDENQNLNLMANMDTQTPVAPVITTNTSSVDLPDRPIPATALVRDKTPILDHVLNLSLAPV
jgi:hypothetical protein